MVIPTNKERTPLQPIPVCVICVRACVFCGVFHLKKTLFRAHTGLYKTIYTCLPVMNVQLARCESFLLERLNSLKKNILHLYRCIHPKMCVEFIHNRTQKLKPIKKTRPLERIGDLVVNLFHIIFHNPYQISYASLGMAGAVNGPESYRELGLETSFAEVFCNNM